MKQFLIVGNSNAITYKDFFPYIKNNEIWLGHRPFTGGMWFEINNPDDCNTNKIINNKLLGNASGCWYTTLIPPYTKPLELTKTYNEADYPKYDNYDAINVDKTINIPYDYDGVMGVPITFLDKYCPDQFEIVDARECALTEKTKSKKTFLIKDADGAINGKPTYARILIRHRK